MGLRDEHKFVLCRLVNGPGYEPRDDNKLSLSAKRTRQGQLIFFFSPVGKTKMDQPDKTR